PVLHAIVARVESALQLILHVQPRQDFLEDVRDTLVLEDPAPSPAGQEPELGHYFRAVTGKRVVARALTEPANDAAEITVLTAAKRQTDGDRPAQQGFKVDLAAVVRKQVKLKAEQLRKTFQAFKTDQVKGILAQWGYQFQGLSALVNHRYHVR